MDKDEQYIPQEDKLLEQAVDFLDHGEEMTDEQLYLLLNDETFLQEAADVLSRREELLASSDKLNVDVEKAWRQFDVDANHKVQRPTFKIQWLLYAATLLIIVGFFWMRSGQSGEQSLAQTEQVAEEGTVLQASAGEQQIKLKTDDGEEIVIAQPADEKKLMAQDVHVKPHVQTVMIPRGRTYRLVLSDGTEVWLNADSQLEYPTRFVGGERFVRLQGEAYFRVHPDAVHPFVIEAGEVRTRVLGTEFNVRSYPGTPAQVTLISGSVEVAKSDTGSKMTLAPGQQATLNAENATFSVEEVDVDSYIYWNEGYFYYDDMPLLSIMQDLGRWYNMNVVFRNSDAKDYKMHFTCDRSDAIDQAVELLNSTQKVKVTISENTIYIE